MSDPRANGATAGPYSSAKGEKGEAPRTWPNSMSAAAQTGLSRKQLDKLVSRGALKCERDSSGVWRWDPELLAVVAEARGDDDDDGDDAVAPLSASQSSLNGQALVLLRQAQGHTEASFKLVLDPMRDLLAARADDITALRARVKELEAKLDESVALREKMLSEQHVRDLVTDDARRSNERKDKAFQMAKDLAPKLLAAVNPGAQKVLALVQSLSDEQRAMMLETDLLTPEQKAPLRELLAAAPLPADVVVEQKDAPAVE